MANSVDPDQTAPIGAVCSGSTLSASILNSSEKLGNYLQQMTSADNIFRYIFFLALYGLSIHRCEIFLYIDYFYEVGINYYLLESILILL